MNTPVDELLAPVTGNEFLLGGGATGTLIRAHEWTATSLGAPEGWPQPLKTLVGVLLAAVQPMFVAWGPKHLLIYNDGYAPMLADRHPAALGRPFFEVWPEVRDELTPLFDRVRAGEPVHMDDIELYLDRQGRAREAHFAFSYTPVRDERGAVVGLFCPCTETTDQVFLERHRTAEAKRQRDLLQQMPGFVAVLHGPDHVFDYVNDAYRELSGPRDFIRRTVREVFPEIAGQGYYELLDRVYATGEPFAARAMPVRLDGEEGERFIDLLYQPMRDSAGSIRGTFVGGYDVTERVRAERRQEALLRLDERLGRVADTADLSFAASELLGEVLGASRVGYGTIDSQAGTITVERNWSAPGLTSVAGVHRFSDFGSYIDDLRRGEPVVNVDVAADPRTADKIASFRALGIGAALDVPVVELGQTVAEIFVHSTVPRVWTLDEIAFVRDFADRTRVAIARRLAEAALRASEEFNRRILQSSADCIKVLDLEGRLEFMSEGGMCTMEVDDFEAVRNARWPDFWLGEEYAQALAAVREAGRGGTARFQGFATTAKGSPRWWDVAVTPIHGADGRPEKLLSVSRDVTAAREADLALRASEARLRAVIEAVPVGLVFGDADGQVTGGNARVEEVVGHPVLPSANIDEYRQWVSFHPDGRQVEGHEYPLARVLSGKEERPELEVLYRRGDGREAWTRFVAAPVRDAEGRIVGGVVASLDVDRERRTEARLRELNADLERQVIERTQARGRSWALSPDLMGAFNASGYFETSNPAWQTVLGWSEDEVRRAPIWELLHPDDLEATREGFALGQVGELGRPAIQLSNRYRRGDGAYRWIAWVGVPEDGLLYCTGRDITAEKEREAALATSMAERDRMWETSPDLLLVIGFDGVLRRVNPAWQAILGHSEDELVGTRLDRFVHPDDLAATEQALVQASGGPVPRIENRYRHKDGSYRWISWITPSPENGLIFATGRHITAEKERQAELEAAQDALRQSQKMEAVGQLTGGIAHDFNNMLAVVIGSLDLLTRRVGASDARSKRYVDAAADGARRAALLTQRLLAFSRQQPLQPEAVDANKLVAGMSDLLRHSLGGDVRLETVLAGGLWRIHADPNQLENLILNLAINGRDAMVDGGGRLTIETANSHLDVRYVSANFGVTPGQYVLIAVTDTGSGMSPEVMSKAFDPFFTTKQVGKGTGLGLSQVYGFVKQSGGHVKIYSEPGQGTTIKVYLPRLLGAENRHEDTATHGELPRGESQETVLVVEDEPAVRQFSVDALLELGYRVLEAEDAATALRMLEAHPEIALMFTDVVMPEVNGAKLAAEAKRRWPTLRVLFTTGYTRNAVVHNGVLDAGVELIGKPFTLDELAAKVRAVLEGPLPPRPAQ